MEETTSTAVRPEPRSVADGASPHSPHPEPNTPPASKDGREAADSERASAAPTFTDLDAYLFHEGTHYGAYRKLGAHLAEENGEAGARFAVFAPNARHVAVITDANHWDEAAGAMQPSASGVWEAFVPGAAAGDAYRYIVDGADGVRRYKSDPYAFFAERRPANASRIFPLDGYEWGDAAYRAQENNADVLERPMAILEVHLGSWRKDYAKDPENGFMNYRDLAHDIADHASHMGYTHVELIGICEYPFDGSWGYQVTGYYAPTSRYGTPDDFRYFVDYLHQRGIGVILDWVPAHFPKDDFGLADFDGTPLYEYADPLRAEFPIWGTRAFDHGRPEVKSFFISNALYWLNEFHVDALRVDAVYAMLCNNFNRSEWRANAYGGAENLESFEFFRHVNSVVRDQSKGYLIAEDVSSILGITTSPEQGGLGYLFKWNMGWMNDVLRYAATSVEGKHADHEDLVHSLDYAFNENYVLEFSHDEVSPGKGSLLSRLPGSELDRFGALKTLYTFQFTHPGKKLLFMGQDIGVVDDWDFASGLDWELANELGHRDVRETVRALLALYKGHPALSSDSMDPATFEWVSRNDSARSTIAFIRKNPWNLDGALLVVCNFSPNGIADYTVGAPKAGLYERVFTTYDQLPGEGGSHVAPLTAYEHECDGRPYTLAYGLRPYESVVFEVPAA